MIFPLIGNTGVKNIIINALKTGNVPHAVIIEGESGQGKKTLADFVAASLVCEGKNKPCNECKNCKLFAAHTHPDIIRIAPEENKKNITVDKIRKLKEEAYIRPQFCDKKIFIIERADTMNENSQNAILKVLEEPPGNAVFILLCEAKSLLLDTVRSRCVCLSLASPDFNEALEYLKSKTDKDEEKIKNALTDAKGNIGKAAEYLTGKENEAVSVAEKYFELITSSSVYELLKTTYIYERDRVGAAEFFGSLKYIILNRVTKEHKSKVRLDELTKMYELTLKFEKKLKENANLPLLFTLAANKYKECM